MSPPEFTSTFSMGRTFRFTTVAALVRQPITRAMLLNLYTMATTTTNQNRLITAIKLKRVRVWGSVSVLGSAPGDVQVEWLSSNAPSVIHSDTGNGIRPPRVSTKPPPDTSERWWSISGSNETENLFTISCPMYTTIDIACSVRLADNEAAVAAESGTAAGATVGRVYWNYLDGFASKQCAPRGGVTILP